MTAPEVEALRLGGDLLDHLQEGCQLIGRDWRTLYANPAAIRNGKTTKDNVIGKSMMESFPGFEHTNVYRVFDRCMQTGEPHTFETEFAFVDGSTSWFELRVQPVPQGIFVLSIDTTARHLAEQQLRQSREEYRGLVENLEGVVFAIDANGMFSYLSPVISTFGYQPDELIGQHFSVLVPADDLAATQEAFSQALSGRQGTREFRLLAKSGRTRYVRCLWRVIHDQGVLGGLTGVLYDVTEHRDIEEQLRVAQKLESIGRLAGGIAHDFNNLLSVILSYSSFALESIPKDNRLHRDIGEVVKAGERAAALTRQLLAFSRKQVMRPVHLSLNDILTSMKPMLRRLISEEIDLIYRLEAALGTVNADVGQIEQVIMNLVLNARDALPRGGSILVSTSNVELDDAYVGMHLHVKAGPHVLLCVTDNGTGMTAEVRERIFEPFFTTKGQGSGTGLGLATVFGIVKQSGGNIYVYSEPGQGTIFKVYLPRVFDTASSSPVLGSPVSATRGSETVLIAEDEEPVREAAVRVLTRSGYQVHAVPDAKAALAFLETSDVAVDLLLTDVVMPGMGGGELAERAMILRPGMKVLYMSGYTDDSIVERGINAGLADVINKPFSASGLAERVRAVLDRHRIVRP